MYNIQCVICDQVLFFPTLDEKRKGKGRKEIGGGGGVERGRGVGTDRGLFNLHLICARICG